MGYRILRTGPGITAGHAALCCGPPGNCKPGPPLALQRRYPASILTGIAYLPAALALAASHFAWVISTKPWPLQEFWPLQELFADLQAECPLQEFTPSHLTLASSAALAAPTSAVENIPAAAAARATLDIFRLFILRSP